MPAKSPLQCHYNRRWGWGKQFQCGSMEIPLPDHYNCRLIEEQEPPEPCLWWHSCNMILICRNNSNARHQIFLPLLIIIENNILYFLLHLVPLNRNGTPCCVQRDLTLYKPVGRGAEVKGHLMWKDEMLQRAAGCFKSKPAHSTKFYNFQVQRRKKVNITTI